MAPDATQQTQTPAAEVPYPVLEQAMQQATTTDTAESKASLSDEAVTVLLGAVSEANRFRQKVESILNLSANGFVSQSEKHSLSNQVKRAAQDLEAELKVVRRRL